MLVAAERGRSVIGLGGADLALAGILRNTDREPGNKIAYCFN